MTANPIAEALGGRKVGDGWMAQCPVNDDHKPSLSIDEKGDKVLVHCHAGCDQTDVIAALPSREVVPFAKQQVQQPEDACNAGRLQLRPYQLDVINECRQKLAAGISKICLVAPTGSGKTVIATEIIRSAVAKGKHVLVLAHTREIIKQTSLKLNAAGIAHGIIMATDTVRPYEPAQVASVQTYWSRVMRTKRMDPPHADLVIVDECHHVRARTWRRIIDSFPGVPLIGLTATPCRSDGRGLGPSFNVLVECP